MCSLMTATECSYHQISSVHRHLKIILNFIYFVNRSCNGIGISGWWIFNYLKLRIDWDPINLCISSVVRPHSKSYKSISSIEHMSQRILSPVANCQDTTFSYYQCVQKPDPRPSNIATGLWKCYAIWHSRSIPSPFGDGPALSGSHCYANSKGWSAVNDNDTATTALAARQETNRIQDTRPRAQGNLRRATSVPCLTAKPAHTETMSTILKRASSRRATNKRRAFRP